jgi:hypothetical protein
MRLAVYDVDVREKDNRKLKLGEQDFLAQATFLLSDLLTAAGQTLTLPLVDAAGRPLRGCTAMLSAEELPNTNAVVRRGGSEEWELLPASGRPASQRFACVDAAAALL